jgi:hypothetical protein
VKLVQAETETQALRDWLDERAETWWTSSVLAEIESRTTDRCRHIGTGRRPDVEAELDRRSGYGRNPVAFSFGGLLHFVHVSVAAGHGGRRGLSCRGCR